MSSENNNSDTPAVAEEKKEIIADELQFDKIQDYQTILEKINLQTVPVSATISSQECPIEKVNIYGGHAEVTRLVKVKLPAGAHKILITDVSHLASDTTFRIGGNKGFVLEATSKFHEDVVEDAPDPEVEAAKKEREKKITDLKEEKNKVSIELQANNSRLEWLKDYASVSKKVLADANNLENTVKFMDFVSDHTTKLMSIATELNDKITQLNKQIADLEREDKPPQPQAPTPQLVDYDIYSKSKSALSIPSTKPVSSMMKVKVARKEVREKKADKKEEGEKKKVKAHAYYYEETGEVAKKIISKQFTVTVFLPTKSKIHLHLSYSVQCSSLRWFPSYNIYFNSAENTAQLICYANIVNHSKEDWTFEEDTKVYVTDGRDSVADLTFSGAPPVVNQFGINTDAPKASSLSSLSSLSMPRFSSSISSSTAPSTSIPLSVAQPAPAPTSTSRGFMSRGSSQPAPVQPQPVQPVPTQIANATNLPPASYRDQSYTITMPVTLPEYAPLYLPNTDRDIVKMVLSVTKINVAFSYAITPKISQSAFLQAACQNNTNWPLLAGSAKLFVDNSFVTSNEVKYTNPKDEFQVTLGIDPELEVDFKQEQTIDRGSKNKTINFIHSFSVKNNKKREVEINVLDLLPTTYSKDDVKITVQKPNVKEDKSVVVSDTGLLKWNAKLAPGKSFQTQSIYSAEISKDRELVFYY